MHRHWPFCKTIAYTLAEILGSAVCKNAALRPLPAECRVLQLQLNKAGLYRVSQEEWVRIREGVPYVKIYRYNPKHLCPKLNGYGDNGQRSLKL
jgi:hypothetical protein